MRKQFHSKHVTSNMWHLPQSKTLTSELRNMSHKQFQTCLKPFQQLFQTCLTNMSPTVSNMSQTISKTVSNMSQHISKSVSTMSQNVTNTSVRVLCWGVIAIYLRSIETSLWNRWYLGRGCSGIHQQSDRSKSALASRNSVRWAPHRRAEQKVCPPNSPPQEIAKGMAPKCDPEMAMLLVLLMMCPNIFPYRFGYVFVYDLLFLDILVDVTDQSWAGVG